VKVIFDFYGVSVTVSADTAVGEKISNDFSFFKVDGSDRYGFEIILIVDYPDYTVIPDGLKSCRHPEHVIYMSDSKDFVDYHGRALSVIDRESRKVTVYSQFKDLLHEIGYLAVLTLAGEALEKRGIYRAHGMAFGYRGRAAVLLADSGIGKSTLLFSLIKKRGFSFYGDDIVLFGRGMKLLPFPVRIGVRDKDKDLFEGIPSRFIYTMNRRRYGMKHLLNTLWLDDRIADPAPVRYLFIACRRNSGVCGIKPVSKAAALPSLIRNVVIGLGLPQLIEYVFAGIERRRLFFLMLKALKRAFFAFKLLAECRVCMVYLGMSGEDNADKILSYMIEK